MMSGDDPMGRVSIPLSLFLKSAPDEEPKTFAVGEMEGCDNPTGTITVKLVFTPNEPDPHEGKLFSGGLLMGIIKRADDLIAVDKNLLSKVRVCR